jgi:pyroglutamyl-peptidase
MSNRPILITGFEPYGGRRLNPAYKVMKRLDRRRIDGRDVVGRALPVALAGLRESIGGLIADINPHTVISLGLWPGESAIRIERLAVNIADFEIADNDGALVIDEPLASKGPSALMATLPVREIETAMLGEGIPARLSTTAGTFLCNACLYSFLHIAEQHPHAIRCGFLHMPFLPEQVAELMQAGRSSSRGELDQTKNLASMELDRIVRAVELAINQC